VTMTEVVSVQARCYQTATGRSLDGALHAKQQSLNRQTGAADVAGSDRCSPYRIARRQHDGGWTMSDPVLGGGDVSLPQEPAGRPLGCSAVRLRLQKSQSRSTARGGGTCRRTTQLGWLYSIYGADARCGSGVAT
jgi:hypothetical protein